jgi:hypothetical protein
MPQSPLTLDLLTAMITPAVLISACGTLIFSTSTRLARVVDRVRQLTIAMDTLYAGAEGDFLEERRAEVERQLSIHARRGRLIQWSLTSYYVSLGLFVGSAVAIGLVNFLPVAAWLPATLGILGTLALFYASVLLINETRLAVRSVNTEMAFALRLRELHGERHRSREA